MNGVVHLLRWYSFIALSGKTNCTCVIREAVWSSSVVAALFLNLSVRWRYIHAQASLSPYRSRVVSTIGNWMGPRVRMHLLGIKLQSPGHGYKTKSLYQLPNPGSSIVRGRKLYSCYFSDQKYPCVGKNSYLQLCDIRPALPLRPTYLRPPSTFRSRPSRSMTSFCTA
jgi:hypothetical protein